MWGLALGKCSVCSVGVQALGECSVGFSIR